MNVLTKVHVGISLIAIFSGLIVMFGLLAAMQFEAFLGFADWKRCGGRTLWGF